MMNTTKRGTMTGVLSQAGRMTTLAVISAVVAPLLPSSATAQVRMTVPPQSQPIALQGATIHTVTNGVIENGTILFSNGLITAIGTDVQLPAGTRVVDYSGKHIYPGLIDAYSIVGISEIGSIGVSNDISSQVQPSRLRADDMPEMRPPPGVVKLTSTPAERVVPMWRLSALTATSARTFGLKSPSSFVSFETSTRPISLIPTVL